MNRHRLGAQAVRRLGRHRRKISGPAAGTVRCQRTTKSNPVRQYTFEPGSQHGARPKDESVNRSAIVLAMSRLASNLPFRRLVAVQKIPDETVMVTVERVRTRAELTEFIALPRRLYDGMSGFVAPLDHERRQMLDPKKSAFFTHGVASYWIARRGGTAVGRVSAQIDFAADEPDAREIGLFGCLDVVDDGEVVAALLRTAEAWLRERKRRIVRGPFLLSINGEPGLLVEGQGESPVTLLGWHPAYLGRASSQRRLHARQRDCSASLQAGRIRLRRSPPGHLATCGRAPKSPCAVAARRSPASRNGTGHAASSMTAGGATGVSRRPPNPTSRDLISQFKPFLFRRFRLLHRYPRRARAVRAVDTEYLRRSPRTSARPPACSAGARCCTGSGGSDIAAFVSL